MNRKQFAETATISNGSVVFGNYRLESAENASRNQFGYTHNFTWEEAHKMGIVIWVEDDGAIWCEDRS